MVSQCCITTNEPIVTKSQLVLPQALCRRGDLSCSAPSPHKEPNTHPSVMEARAEEQQECFQGEHPSGTRSAAGRYRHNRTLKKCVYHRLPGNTITQKQELELSCSSLQESREGAAKGAMISTDKPCCRNLAKRHLQLGMPDAQCPPGQGGVLALWVLRISVSARCPGPCSGEPW